MNIKTQETQAYQATRAAKKPHNYMCVQSNGSVIVAGTEFKEDNAFVHIWQLGQPDQQLYSINESLGDDLTMIRFHPQYNSILLTSCTDGLVCVFDISKLKPFKVDCQEEEEAYQESDALLGVMNADSCVVGFGFFGSQSEFLYVRTSDETLQLWSLATFELLNNFGDIRTTLEVNGRQLVSEYIVDCYFYRDRLYMCSGDSDGCIQIWHLNLSDMQLIQAHVKHSSTVRALTIYKDKMYTGSEDGTVSEIFPFQLSSGNS